MPKLKETPAQVADRMYREAMAAGLVRTGMMQKDLADSLDITTNTLRNHRKDPSFVTVGQLRKMHRMGVLTSEDVTRIICY